jgi:hypothetical protein
MVLEEKIISLKIFSRTEPGRVKNIWFYNA